MNDDLTLRDLITRYSSVGRVEQIIVRPARHEAAISVPMAEAVPGQGLVGDRRSLTRRAEHASRKRELTLIQAEHIPLIGQWCGVMPLDATRLRRNIVISGLNLLAMKSPFKDVQIHFRLGAQVVIEMTGPCDPCSKMEMELTPISGGGYNAMRGHGGVTALIVSGGVIRIGDAVQLHSVQRSQRR